MNCCLTLHFLLPMSLCVWFCPEMIPTTQGFGMHFEVMVWLSIVLIHREIDSSCDTHVLSNRGTFHLEEKKGAATPRWSTWQLSTVEFSSSPLFTFISLVSQTDGASVNTRQLISWESYHSSAMFLFTTIATFYRHLNLCLIIWLWYSEGRDQDKGMF